MGTAHWCSRIEDLEAGQGQAGVLRPGENRAAGKDTQQIGIGNRAHREPDGKPAGLALAATGQADDVACDRLPWCCDMDWQGGLPVAGVGKRCAERSGGRDSGGGVQERHAHDDSGSLSAHCFHDAPSAATGFDRGYRITGVGVERTGEFRVELSNRERLDDEGRDTGLARLRNARLVRKGGEKDKRNPRIPFPDLMQEVEPGQAGHVQIGKDQVEPVGVLIVEFQRVFDLPGREEGRRGGAVHVLRKGSF